MNLNQIEFIRSLDKNGTFGTVQGVLMNPNLSTTSFESVAKYLLSCMVQERQTILKENALMQKELQKHGLYTSELLGLGGVN